MNNNLQQIKPKNVLTLSNSPYSVIKYGAIQLLKGNKILRILFSLIAIGLFIFAILNFMFPIFSISSYAWFLPLIIIAVELGNWVVIASGDFRVVFPAQEAVKERQNAEAAFNTSSDPKDLLNLDYKRLNEYYIINQNQAKSSFRWAVFAMLMGLATIISGIWLFYFKQDIPDTFMASLSVGAGCVVNLVSGLFLYLHNETQKKSLHYYGQLTRIQHISLAMRLVEEQPNDETKTESRNKVIEHLLKFNPTNDVFTQISAPDESKKLTT